MKAVARLLSLQVAVYLVVPVCFLLICALSSMFSFLNNIGYFLSTNRFDVMLIMFFLSSTLFAIPFCMSLALMSLSTRLFLFGTKDFRNAELLANIVVFMTMIGFVLNTLKIV